jgi:hypothetical protein
LQQAVQATCFCTTSAGSGLEDRKTSEYSMATRTTNTECFHEPDGDNWRLPLVSDAVYHARNASDALR